MAREQVQYRLGSPGGVVTGLAELEQSLRIILQSPLGSVPGRPRFGSLLHELVDAPLGRVRSEAPAEVVRAVGESDPRLTVHGTAVAHQDAASGHFELEVSWSPSSDTGDQQTTNVSI